MKKFKNFILMTLGCVLLAMGVYFFKIPNNFVTGGVSGMGTILASITPLSAGIWIWILNAVLLVLGFAILGKKTVAKTVYCSMLYSAITYVFEFVAPMSKPFSDEPVLELVYAMLLTAIGSAMIFNGGGSSGGTDIVALILQKYTKAKIGTVLLVTDFIVAASSFFFFGVKAGLLSLVGLFVKAFVVDGVIDSFNSCKYFVVITSEKDKICEYIMKTLHHGVTVHAAVGEYTQTERAMIHTVCSRLEAIKLRAAVKELDPGAFIIITTSSEIIGRGFRSV